MTRREIALGALGILLGFALARGCTDEEAAGDPSRSDRHPATTTERTTTERTTTSSTRSTTTAEPAVAQRTAPTPPASVRTPGETTRTAGGDRLRSTAYCLTGGMASGRPTYVGAVAANRYKLGTRLTITPNPWNDPSMVFTVEDRHADGATELDFAMPHECSRALAWGNRRYVTARVVE